MSDTVYLVRLRRAFASWYDAKTDTTHDVCNANMRVFASLSDAEQFASTAAPIHSPFLVDAIDYSDDEDGFEVNADTDETDWEYYMTPDNDVAEDSDDEEDFEGDFEEDVIPNSQLIEAIQNAGLPARTAEPWQTWWETNAPTMTDAQRATIWRVFTDNPYLIMALPAEL